MEIYFKEPKRAGLLSLTKNGEKQNAKPILIDHTTHMWNFMTIIQGVLYAHYVKGET